ncbi:hypothetical protein GCM10027093_36610 [Paraburkholderia jirisanensis]
MLHSPKTNRFHMSKAEYGTHDELRVTITHLGNSDCINPSYEEQEILLKIDEQRVYLAVWRSVSYRYYDIASRSYEKQDAIMNAVRVVGALCAVAVLVTGVAAWASATESAWMTGRLIDETQSGHQLSMTDARRDVKTCYCASGAYPADDALQLR